MQTSENKKVLLRISNLKQYFPLKKKGLFVKANDGITLDIYEGETFGLVGESGCGKSTLGRTLLQLYRQTDGRTMYYGRSLEEIAPRYVERTLKSIDKHRAQWKALAKAHEAVKREYDAMPDGEAKYSKFNDVAKAQKDENDALLDMANLIGGFVALEDIKEPVALFLQEYAHAGERKKVRAKRKAIQLDIDDMTYAAEKAEKAGENASGKLNWIKRLLRSMRRLLSWMNSWRRCVRRLMRSASRIWRIRSLSSMKRFAMRALIWPDWSIRRSVCCAAIFS